MCRSVTGVWLVIALLLGDTANAVQYAYQVTFTDKYNSPYSLGNPLIYLSSRSIARRTLQGISVDTTDFPVNPAYIDSVLSLTGGKFHESSRWLNFCIVLLSDSSQIHTLDGKPFISNIKLVGVYGTDLHRISHTTGTQNSQLVKKTTGTDSDYYGNTWLQTNLVNGNYLHDQGYNGEGKLIAVLDEGFEGTDTISGFSNLWSSGRVVDTFNFTYNNSNIFYQGSHGTEVLSTMAGYVPNTYVGSAPMAMYALYITEYYSGDQPLELDNLLCAAERADSLGADIITISLGYDLFDNPADGLNFSTDLDGKTTIAAKAANIATTKGMLFVATAGNDGSPQIPGWGNHILTPGDADSALTIGATDVTGNAANISGYGPNAAGQIKPDVCGMGAPAYIINSSGIYTSGSGTSYSTPQIAGWAACLWQANPKATPWQLRQAIIKCASSYNTPGQQLGYGVPNFECTEQVLNVKDTPPPFSPSNWVIASPNPFTGNLVISVSPNVEGNVDFRITDMTGKLLSFWHLYLDKSNNKPINLSTAQLPPGIYILKVNSATLQDVIKLEKR